MYSTRIKRTPQKSRRSYFIAATVLIAIAAICGVALLVNHHSTSGSKQISLTSNSKDNVGKKSNANLPSNTTNQTNSASNSSPSTSGSAKSPDTPMTASGAAPKAPTGQFVSSHTASLNSSSNFGVTTEDSVCNTSAGATCEITFTQNGVTKSLGKKTVDGSGAAYWSGWKIADYLTSGTWKITATASLNGQTTSTTDVNNLVIN